MAMSMDTQIWKWEKDLVGEWFAVQRDADGKLVHWIARQDVLAVLNEREQRIATLTEQLAAATERADLLEHQRCDLESALHSSERHVAHFREKAEAAERECDAARADASVAAMRAALVDCQSLLVVIGNYVGIDGAYEHIRQTRAKIDAALAGQAGAAMLERVKRYDTLTPFLEAWRQAWHEAKTWQDHTHVFISGEKSEGDRLWEIETEKALALLAALDGKEQQQ